MSKVKSDLEILVLREGGKHLGDVLHKVSLLVKPGVKASELNSEAERMIREFGDEPSFLNYTPFGADRPYPATLCVSVNDEIVHGIPNEVEKILMDGDLVGLDLGLRHKGLFVDAAVTVPVGVIDDIGLRLIDITEKSLYVGINECVIGNRIGDIGCAIEKFAKPHKFGIVEELGGHGVGHKVHEDPHIANYCMKDRGVKIVEGMVLALEPILNEGSKHIYLDDDGYTFKTADGKRSAHFEHTIVVTKNGPEILTI